MLLALYNATIRVNGDNILPQPMLEDEIPVYKAIWGAENVDVGDQTGTSEVNPEDEASRLFMKFPRKDVEAVYQKDALMLPQMMRQMAAPARKRTAA